jgi:hypothetical protein
MNIMYARAVASVEFYNSVLCFSTKRIIYFLGWVLVMLSLLFWILIAVYCYLPMLWLYFFDGRCLLFTGIKKVLISAFHVLSF